MEGITCHFLSYHGVIRLLVMFVESRLIRYELRGRNILGNIASLTIVFENVQTLVQHLPSLERLSLLTSSYFPHDFIIFWRKTRLFLIFSQLYFFILIRNLLILSARLKHRLVFASLAESHQ